MDRRLTITAIALLAAALWLDRDDRRRCRPESYALELAGVWSADCGLLGPRDDHGRGIDCLLKAQEEGGAARLLIRRDGMDSTVADVFVRKADGTSLLLGYDGDPWGGGGDDHPSLRQKRCERFERVIRERAFHIGPDVECVHSIDLPSLCESERPFVSQ